MKPISDYPTKICLLFTLFFSAMILNTNAQSYLPLTGGTLTGSLSLSGSTVTLALPALQFNNSVAQPSTATVVSIFPNNTSQALDLVGWTNGWHFVPGNSSSYSAPVVTIDPSGNTNITGNAYVGKNLGIGTTAPTYLLDVEGTGATLSGTAQFNAVFAQDRTNYRGVLLGYDGSGQIGVIAPTNSSSSAANNLAFWNNNGSSWKESMRITSAGNVGIGTTTPGASLSLGNAAGYAKLALFESGNYQWGFGINTQEMEQYFASDNTNNHISWGSMSFDGNHTFTEYMRLTSAGHLLLGQTNQVNATTAYLLDVKGPVRANSIVVNISGADFVFKPDYKLATLPALQSYINRNHHLPGIASAKEMQTKGVDLAENQTKLLQKVEELTLYLINKDKVQTEQTNTIKQQQQEIELLKQQMQILINKLK